MTCECAVRLAFKVPRAEEGGVRFEDRAFADGFDPPEKNQYYERLLTVTSGLDRGQVLPFGSPAWKGKVPLTDFLLLDIVSFRADALRRFTAAASIRLLNFVADDFLCRARRSFDWLRIGLMSGEAGGYIDGAMRPFGVFRLG